MPPAARAPIAGLPEYAATVAGRRISLWMSFQSRAQPCRDLRGRPGNKETAAYIEDLLGEISRFAHSETAHHGQETAEGKSEKGVPLLSAWEIRRMKDQDVVIFHREVPPFRAKRLDWRNFPSLVARTKHPVGTVKLAESRLGGSRVGRVNGRDDDASRSDLCRLSIPC